MLLRADHNGVMMSRQPLRKRPVIYAERQAHRGEAKHI